MSRRLLPNSDTFQVGASLLSPLAKGEKRQAQLELLKRIAPDAMEIRFYWHEVLANGRGTPNVSSLSDYDRLTDESLERGIRPIALLPSCAIPDALEDKGGWTNRDAIYWYADYSKLLADKLGDRIQLWFTQSDPAANRAATPYKAWASAYHRLLAHPFAREAMRAERESLQLGVGLRFNPIFPASDRTRDHEAALRIEAEEQAFYLDLLYLGRFNEAALAYAKFESGELDFLRESDKHKLLDSADALRLDYEFRPVIDVKDAEAFTRKAKLGRGEIAKGEPYGHRRSAERLAECLKRLKERYDPKGLWLATSPYEVPEEIPEGERIRDIPRSLYHSHHLQAVQEAVEAQVDIHGYLWEGVYSEPGAEEGYIAERDDDSFLIKDSGYWLKAVQATRNPHWEADIDYKELD